jgi:hypothetical protein
MLGTNIEYSPFENWMVTVGSSKFMGDGNDNSHNIFNKLESFSNTTVAVKYSF